MSGKRRALVLTSIVTLGKVGNSDGPLRARGVSNGLYLADYFLKKAQASLVILAALCVTQGARADICTELVDQSVLTRGASARSLAPVVLVNAVELPVYEWAQANGYPADPFSTFEIKFDAVPSNQHVLQLPPAPSSVALFFSAMASIGAWQLVRCSKDLHFAAMPDWYHTGGPVQVGHTTALDLDFHNLPLCRFDEPGGERPLCYDVRRSVVVRLKSLQFLSIADPRGPPTPAV